MEHQINVILVFSEKITFNVVSGPKVQNIFFNAVQPVRLNIIKPWSVTCPDTKESLQKMQFGVNYVIKSKMSIYQGDIAKVNVNTIVNGANETLLGGEVIHRAIHEAAGPGLLDECQKVNGCEIGVFEIMCFMLWG